MVTEVSKELSTDGVSAKKKQNTCLLTNAELWKNFTWIKENMGLDSWRTGCGTFRVCQEDVLNNNPLFVLIKTLNRAENHYESFIYTCSTYGEMNVRCYVINPVL